ncbi:MAG: hypothetical protein ACRDP7_23125 [Trebonia sp.]
MDNTIVIAALPAISSTPEKLLSDDDPARFTSVDREDWPGGTIMQDFRSPRSCSRPRNLSEARRRIVARIRYGMAASVHVRSHLVRSPPTHLVFTGISDYNSSL